MATSTGWGVLLSFFFLFYHSPAVRAQEATVSFQVFYDDLGPYGDWMLDPGYGYVWIPALGSDFVPYGSAGHWEFTEFGWAWVSDYDWGWAPFHYGRWDYADSYGWFWVPGETWGPAWVCWRHSPGYYGWAPLGPGAEVVATGTVVTGRQASWTFVEEKYMGSGSPGQHYAPRSNNATIINNSVVINKTVVENSKHVAYIAGPDKEEVQKATGKQINTLSIAQRVSHGQKVSGNQLAIYHPAIQKATASNPNPAPAKVANANDLHKPAANTGKGNVSPQQNGKTKASHPSSTVQKTPAPSKSQSAPKSKPAPKSNQNPAPAQKSSPSPKSNKPPKQPQTAPAQHNHAPVMHPAPQGNTGNPAGGGMPKGKKKPKSKDVQPQ